MICINPWTTTKLLTPLQMSTPSGGGRKVSVVYYLCRNGQLEHPHFMEVIPSSPNALFLRDVIGRLNVLRGEGMAATYSWSCKRSYKHGFVWHDLSDDDFILAVNGDDEYVLKGSEKKKIDVGERRRRNLSCGGAIDLNVTEYSVYKALGTDASTQTDEGQRRRRREEEEKKKIAANGNEMEIEITPPASDSSSETLEALMKSDGVRASSATEESTAEGAQSVKEEEKSWCIPQLISCGPRESQKGIANLISSHKEGIANLISSQKGIANLIRRVGRRTEKMQVASLKRSISCRKLV